MSRSAKLKAALFVAALTVSISANAMADSPKPVNVPAGDLTTALELLEKQSQVEIVYRPELLKGLHTSGVKGTLSSEEAVTKLLEGTTLKLHTDRSGVLLITEAGTQRAATSRAGESEGESRDKKGDNSSGERLQLAQASHGSNSGSFPVDSLGSSARERGGAQGRDDSSTNRQTLEEVVVTAQKREQREFDVPISIVALSAEELQKREINSIDDLSMVVPGLSVQSSGNTRRILLRGVSNLTGGSPLIGLYLDEASVTAGPFLQPDLSTYDLERVEVLRGPQGTLYGEGSVGGTIRFITKNPQLDRFAMNADVAALFTEDGAPGQRVESVLNVPLIENTLGLRMAGTFDHDGGWIDQPAANAKNINGQDLADVRIKGLWQPTPQFAVNAMTVIHRNDGAPNFGEDAHGNFTQTFNLTTTPSVQDDYDLYNLTLTYDFPSVRVLSTTTYVAQDELTSNEAKRYQVTPPGTPRVDLYLPMFTWDTHNLNEELRLASTGSGPWQWTAGAFYRHFQFDQDIPAEYYHVPGPAGTPLPTPFCPCDSSSLSKSWAAFSDTSYKLTDRFTVGTGLRFFQDDQESTSGPPPTTQTGRFHSVDPRFYGQYMLTDQVNTYASAAKGFRSGGFNQLNRPSYGPESVWTYELGTKMSLAAGRLSTDAAIFYSDYNDYQITGIVLNPPLDITSNAGKARIKGVEWTWTWQPVDEWSLSFNGDYVDSKFVEINATSTAYNVGDPLDGFPKYQYTLSAERDFKWGGKPGFVRLDYEQQGHETYRNRSIGPWYFDESEIINMLNFNMRLKWSDSLSLGLFAQNLLNDRGFITTGSIEQVASRSRPRTFGIEFEVKLD